MDTQLLMKARHDPSYSKDRWSYKSRYLERELMSHGAGHQIAASFPDLYCLTALVDARVGIVDTLIVCNTVTEKDESATAGTSLLDKLQKGSVLHLHSSWQHISGDLLARERSYIRSDMDCLLADLTDDMYNNSLSVDVYGKFVPVPLSALLKAVCLTGKLHVRPICNTDDLLLALEELLGGHTFARGVITLPDRSEPWMRRQGKLFYRYQYALNGPDRFSRVSALPQPRSESVVEQFPSSLCYLRDDFEVAPVRSDDVDPQLRQAAFAARDAILSRYAGGSVAMLTGMTLDLEACVEVGEDMQMLGVLCYRVCSVLNTSYTPILRTGRRNAVPSILGLTVDSLRLFSGIYRREKLRAREEGGAEERTTPHLHSAVADIEREAAATSTLLKSEEAAYLAGLARRMVGEYNEYAADAEVWEDVTGEEGEELGAPPTRAEPAEAHAPAEPAVDAQPRLDLIRPAQLTPAPVLYRGPLPAGGAEAGDPSVGSSLASAAPVMSMGAFLQLWSEVCEQERLASIELERLRESQFEEERQLQRAAYDTAAGMSALDLLSAGQERVIGEVGRRLERLRPPARAPEPAEEPVLRSVRMEDVFSPSGFELDCDCTFQSILEGLYRDKAYALIEKYLRLLRPQGGGKRPPPEQLQLSAGDVETILHALQTESPAVEEVHPAQAASEAVAQRAFRHSVLGLFQRVQSVRDTGADSTAFSRQRSKRQTRIRAALAKRLRGRALRALDLFVCRIDGALVTEEEREAQLRAEEQDELRRSRAFHVRRERALQAEEPPPRGGALWGRMLGEAGVATQQSDAERRHAEQQIESPEEQSHSPGSDDGQEQPQLPPAHDPMDDPLFLAYLQEQHARGSLDDPMDDELDEEPAEEPSELAASTLSSLTLPLPLSGALPLATGTDIGRELPHYEPQHYEPLYYELPYYEPLHREPLHSESSLGVRGSSRTGRAAAPQPQPPRGPQPSIALPSASGRSTRRKKMERPLIDQQQHTVVAGGLLHASTAPLSRRRVGRRSDNWRQVHCRPPPAAVTGPSTTISAPVLLSAVHDVTVERRERSLPPSAVFYLVREGGDEWRPEETIVALDDSEDEQEPQREHGGLHPTSIERLLEVCARSPIGPALHTERSGARAAGRPARTRCGAARSRTAAPPQAPAAPEQLALLAVPIRGPERSLPDAHARRSAALEAEQPMHRLHAQRWRAERRAVRGATLLLVRHVLVGGAVLALESLAPRPPAESPACAPHPPAEAVQQPESGEEEPPAERTGASPPPNPNLTMYMLDGRLSIVPPAPLVVSGGAALPSSFARTYRPASAVPTIVVPAPGIAAECAATASEHVLMHVTTRERLAGRTTKHVSSPDRRFVSRHLVQRAAETRLRDAQRGITYFDVIRRSEPISTDAPPLLSSDRLQPPAEKGCGRAPAAQREPKKALAVSSRGAAAALARRRWAPADSVVADDLCPASSVIFIASEPAPPPRAADERLQLLRLEGRSPETASPSGSPRKSVAPASAAAHRYVHRIMGSEAVTEAPNDDVSVEVEEVEMLVRRFRELQQEDWSEEEKSRGIEQWQWRAPEFAPPPFPPKPKLL